MIELLFLSNTVYWIISSKNDHFFAYYIQPTRRKKKKKGRKREKKRGRKEKKEQDRLVKNAFVLVKWLRCTIWQQATATPRNYSYRRAMRAKILYFPKLCLCVSYLFVFDHLLKKKKNWGLLTWIKFERTMISLLFLSKEMMKPLLKFDLCHSF